MTHHSLAFIQQPAEAQACVQRPLYQLLEEQPPQGRSPQEPWNAPNTEMNAGSGRRLPCHKGWRSQAQGQSGGSAGPTWCPPAPSCTRLE
ncbi:Tetratricopeptide Repeat Protein 16 [Manis pentadactyla]|nr:Tetratricopeptide Repeat Protein 16 [Manis pentadactyla]